MRRRLAAFALVATFAAALAGPAAAANLLVNGGFEADDASAAPYYLRQIPTGWTQVGGLDTVDIIHDAYTQGPAVLLDPQEGDQFLDMNGALASGGIYQDVTGLGAGQQLSLSFYVGKWATNGPGQVVYSLVDLGSNSVIGGGTRVVGGAGDVWERVSLTGVTTSGDVRVQFVGQAFFQAGPGLDNVSLTAGVPEPAAWALMILGFGAVGAGVRRRRAALT